MKILTESLKSEFFHLVSSQNESVIGMIENIGLKRKANAKANFQKDQG